MSITEIPKIENLQPHESYWNSKPQLHLQHTLEIGTLKIIAC